MGITHLLGGGAPELAGLGGESPMLTPDRLAIIGSDPRETTDAGRRHLRDLQVSLTEAPAFVEDPVGAARRALAAISGDTRKVLLHFDIDVVASADLPLGNFPHYGSGVHLEDALAALGAVRADPSFAGLVLTEINPTYDPAGTELDRLVDGLVTVLSA